MSYLISWKDQAGREYSTPVFWEGTQEENVEYFKQTHPSCVEVTEVEPLVTETVTVDRPQGGATTRSQVSATNSPSAYCKHLLVKREFSDQEIYEQVMNKFPQSNFKIQYVNIKRNDFNRTTYKDDPIKKIVK
jgi:hypothetical protein